jgi:hypothetical protein
LARGELPLNDAKEGKKKKRLLKGSIRSLAATFFSWGLQKCPPFPEHMEKKERSSVINKAHIHSLYAIIMGFFPEHA